MMERCSGSALANRLTRDLHRLKALDCMMVCASERDRKKILSKMRLIAASAHRAIQEKYGIWLPKGNGKPNGQGRPRKNRS